MGWRVKGNFPETFKCLLEKNRNVIHQPRSVHIGRNCALGLSMASGGTQDLGHSFFQYGPPSRWITYIYPAMGSTGVRLIFFCREAFIGVRAGGTRGAAAPPNFGQLRFFGQQEKIWPKPGFKDVSLFFLLLFWRDKYFIFYSDKNPDVGRRNNQVTFSRDIGCLARDEFLVIRKGYHTLIYIFIVFLSI